MKKFSIKEIEDVIKDHCWEHKIEDTNKSWGDVSVTYTKTINPGELLYALKKIAKNETK
jgi:hypothetical protein